MELTEIEKHAIKNMVAEGKTKEEIIEVVGKDVGEYIDSINKPRAPINNGGGPKGTYVATLASMQAYESIERKPQKDPPHIFRWKDHDKI